MAKKRPGKNKAIRRIPINGDAGRQNSSNSPWHSAPMADVAGDPVASGGQTNAAASSPQGQSSWTDAFDSSPWVGESGESKGTYVPSQDIRNKLHARRLRLQAEGAEGYTNPWNEPAMASSTAAPLPEDEPAQAKIPESVNKKKNKGGTRKHSPVENVESEILATGPYKIPVEDLANGVINALGDGLGVVIHSSALAGQYVITGVQFGAKKVASGAMAGVLTIASVGMVCEFTNILTGDIDNPWD